MALDRHVDLHQYPLAHGPPDPSPPTRRQTTGPIQTAYQQTSEHDNQMCGPTAYSSCSHGITTHSTSRHTETHPTGQSTTHNLPSIQRLLHISWFHIPRMKCIYFKHKNIERWPPPAVFLQV